MMGCVQSRDASPREISAEEIVSIPEVFRQTRSHWTPGVRGWMNTCEYSERKLRFTSQGVHYELEYGAVTKRGVHSRGECESNQDCFSVSESFPPPAASGFTFVVLDGHGEFGHLCSQFVRSYIATEFGKVTQRQETESPGAFFSEVLYRANSALHQEKYNGRIDDSVSGTTTCGVVLDTMTSTLVTVNIGDSKAVATIVGGEDDSDQSVSIDDSKAVATIVGGGDSSNQSVPIGEKEKRRKRVVELCSEQNCWREDEVQRILNKGGEVFTSTEIQLGIRAAAAAAATAAAAAAQQQSESARNNPPKLAMHTEARMLSKELSPVAEDVEFLQSPQRQMGSPPGEEGAEPSRAAQTVSCEDDEGSDAELAISESDEEEMCEERNGKGSSQGATQGAAQGAGRPQSPPDDASGGLGPSGGGAVQVRVAMRNNEARRRMTEERERKQKEKEEKEQERRQKLEEEEEEERRMKAAMLKGAVPSGGVRAPPSTTSASRQQMDNADPPRVYLKGASFPGTAFTRSIGDSIAESVGVNAIGELSSVPLSSPTFGRVSSVVVATDGVWEFMKDEEVMELGDNEEEEVLTAAFRIVSSSYLRWTQNETMVDDITVILIRLRETEQSEEAGARAS